MQETGEGRESQPENKLDANPCLLDPRVHHVNNSMFFSVVQTSAQFGYYGILSKCPPYLCYDAEILLGNILVLPPQISSYFARQPQPNSHPKADNESDKELN